MSDVLGDISLDNGYAEALIIFGDSTIQGVGGGVCQVSTTLFRTAYYAGFEIIERTRMPTALVTMNKLQRGTAPTLPAWTRLFSFRWWISNSETIPITGC